MESITVTLPPGVTARAFWSFIAASSNRVQGAVDATLRRADNDGAIVTPEEARAIVFYARAASNAELAKLDSAPGMTNGLRIGLHVAGGSK